MKTQKEKTAKRDSFWPKVIKAACDADRASVKLRSSIFISSGGMLSIYNDKGECITWHE